jgi:hypothetical protein
MPAPIYTPAVLRSWIEALQTPSKPLTPWELNFVESVSDQLDRGRTLTPTQVDALERIYAEKTD